MENGLEQQVLAKAQKWLDGNYDAETKKQVKYLMDNDMKELVESFYKDLEFGTGGLRHYDYDKDYPFAAFITNLGKYNEGALVGEWVKFPTTAEELKKVFERIGIGSKDEFGQTYEEWFITDYDCYVDGLYDLLGEYANLDELNYLASKLDDMSQDEYERFQASGKRRQVYPFLKIRILKSISSPKRIFEKPPKASYTARRTPILKLRG